MSGNTSPVLSPAAHIRLLHPPGSLGRIAVGPLTQTGRAHTLKRTLEIADTLAGATDIYVSMNRFGSRRESQHLAVLNACYVDLDVYTVAALAGLAADYLTTCVLAHLQEQRLPAPSYVMSSGRGLQMVWLHAPLSAQAQPRWAAVQRELVARLSRFGADPAAKDSARVLRLAGTINGRCGRVVRPTYLPAATQEGHRFCFEDLAHEILPIARTVLVERRRASTARAKRATAAHGRARTPQTYWRTVLTDLDRLARHRWPEGIPPGQRDAWMFVVASGLAWLLPPEALEPACQAMQAAHIAWRPAELQQCITAVVSRARRAQRGERICHRDRQLDPRYRMSVKEIVSRLSITSDEMMVLNLRALIDAPVRRARERQRSASRRQQAGQQARDAYETIAQDRRPAVARLRAAGLSWRRIGAALGISESEARRLAKTATVVPAACAGFDPVYGGLPARSSALAPSASASSFSNSLIPLPAIKQEPACPNLGPSSLMPSLTPLTSMPGSCARARPSLISLT